MQTLNDELRMFIIENIMYGQNTKPLTDRSSFLESGIIDSTGVLELINYLETRFSIHVADEDLVPKNLDSITGLIQFIERKSSNKP